MCIRDSRKVLLVTQSLAALLAVALWLIVATGVVHTWMVFALALLLELAMPRAGVADLGDTTAEVLACVTGAVAELTTTPFGPVIRALVSEITVDPALGHALRETVLQARWKDVAAVIRRGIGRGDLAPVADSDLSADLLIGPVYFRLVFGGALDASFARDTAEAFTRAYAPRKVG